MVEALECTLTTLSISRGEWRDNLPRLCWGQASRKSEPWLHWERRPPENRCAYGTPQYEPMLTKLDLVPAQ